MAHAVDITSTVTKIDPRAAGAKSGMEKMVWIPGGTFLMGSDRHYAEEAPAHHVTVDGFGSINLPSPTRTSVASSRQPSM